MRCLEVFSGGHFYLQDNLQEVRTPDLAVNKNLRVGFMCMK